MPQILVLVSFKKKNTSSYTVLPLSGAQTLAHKRASGAPCPCTSIHLSMYPTSISGASTMFQLLTSPGCWGDKGGQDTVLSNLEQRPTHKRTFGEQPEPTWEARDCASSFLPCVLSMGQLNDSRVPHFTGILVFTESLNTCYPLDAPACEIPPPSVESCGGC